MNFFGSLRHITDIWNVFVPIILFSHYILYTYHYDIIIQSSHILISLCFITNSLHLILLEYTMIFYLQSILILKVLNLNSKFCIHVFYIHAYNLYCLISLCKFNFLCIYVLYVISSIFHIQYYVTLILILNY